jgi:phosphate transport system permease protein
MVGVARHAGTTAMTGPALDDVRAVAAERRSAFARRAARSLRRRKITSAIMVSLMIVAALLATLPLVLILSHLIRTGASSLSVSFFTQMPRPVGETGGGMAHAIVGTLYLVGIACVVGLPIGIGAGLYLAERRTARLASIVRFLADVLNGLPSIVMGIFAWKFLVRPFHSFSALAGGIALAAMMIPLVTRTTEEVVRLVPVSLREAALALGYTRWRTSLTVIVRTAAAGIVTGVLVAVARIAGETAPLLFTVLGSNYWSLRLDQPIAALPLQIFTYAITPYDDWHRQAWAGALVLIALVFAISLAARAATRSRFHGSGD